MSLNRFVEERTKLIIFGFIRKEQEILTKLHPNNPFYIIAQLIIHHIIYYYNDPEYFSKTGDHAEISDDKLSVTVKKRGYVTCYGNNIIPSTCKMIHCWKFHVEQPGFNCCGIGIDEAPGICTDSDFYKQTDKTYYAFENSARKYSNSDSDEYHIGEDYGASYCVNSTIEMILNLIDGTLSYSVNGIDHGICFKVKQENELNYVMAVTMYLHQQKITLLKYSNK